MYSALNALPFVFFEEVGGDTRKILEETGKNMVLQKLVQKHQKDLVYLKKSDEKARISGRGKISDL